MKNLAKLTFFLLWFASNSSIAETRELGICEADGQREVKSVRYNVEERKDVDGAFVAKLTCSADIVVIKQCALIGVKSQKVQEFCFPEGQPSYFEYFDVVDYWTAREAP